jgi:hypothetical protein
MKFAVCSLAMGSDYKRSVVGCSLSQARHAQKHGYDRITEELPFDSVRRELQWSKIPLIQKYLSSYDYIVWIDGDVLITNQERPIDDFIALMRPDEFLLIGRDFQGLNSGVFIIKNCTKAHEFLKEVWEFQGFDRQLFHEQTAIDHLIKEDRYSQGVQTIPHEHINILNAFDYRMDPRVHWLPGDFCIHFAGIKDVGIRTGLQDMYTRFSSSDPAGTERIQEYLRKRII